MVDPCAWRQVETCIYEVNRLDMISDDPVCLVDLAVSRLPALEGMGVSQLAEEGSRNVSPTNP